MNKRNGFTLIELLVVIAIIAVLAGALLLAINPAALIQKGNDANRLQSLDALVKGINIAITEGELVLTANGQSCISCISNTGTQAVDGTGWVKFSIPTGKTGLSKYIHALPHDPLNTGVNIYKFGSTTSGFEIDAVLEHPDNAVKMSTDGGNDPNIYEVGTNLSIL